MTAEARPSHAASPVPRSAFRMHLGKPWLALPLLAFFLMFVALPIVMLLSAAMTGPDGVSLVHFTRFFTDGLSLPVLGRTLLLGLATAAVALVLGYPLALLFVSASTRVQRLLILMIVLPLLTSAVVRTFAWVVVLGRQGLVNEALIWLGVIGAPIPLLYTEPMLILTLAQIELPLMTLPIISALSLIDPRLQEASTALGAGRWRTLFLVVFPLSLPGVIAGVLLVFAAACGALVTQSIVGGGRLLFMPMYIYQQGMQGQNWPFAAAISLMLLVSVLAVVTALNVLGRIATRHLHV
ncbi:ABC transporter permease [Aquabacter sp. CN5-332]|uniref:ABC transporter permease n=1 Tax=Aquabacter sp. CN5-332 TaxID=3156608 RepID=UPI0032B41172